MQSDPQILVGTSTVSFLIVVLIRVERLNEDSKAEGLLNATLFEKPDAPREIGTLTGAVWESSS